jgi:hypothetical protein
MGVLLGADADRGFRCQAPRQPDKTESRPSRKKKKTEKGEEKKNAENGNRRPQLPTASNKRARGDSYGCQAANGTLHQTNIDTV